jgi:RNA polymerase sigma-70 factor, ECF subfamily
VDQLDLVERAKRGDHDAFAALAGGAIDRLLTASRLILRDAELARDATQDALIRAWRDLPGLRDPARFDAWLHRLTVNACLDLVRRRTRRPIEVELGEIDVSGAGDYAAALAERDMVDAALRRLDPEWRAIVVLHYYLGLPISEIATTTRLPEGTVKSRLNRALTVLRGAVNEDADDRRAAVGEGQLA